MQKSGNIKQYRSRPVHEQKSRKEKRYENKKQENQKLEDKKKEEKIQKGRNVDI